MKLNQLLTRTKEHREQGEAQQSNYTYIFRDKPFYCEWVSIGSSKISCCFNHIIGLPQDSVTGEPKPLYQWQYDHIIKNLEQYKYNFVLKATGIGLSEIALRWILYKSLVNDKWSNGIVPIFTGVNYDLARRLIDRAATMVRPFFPYAKENERTIRINNVEITAFPGGHMDTARSLTNCRFFFLDEYDFYDEAKNIESSRKIAERQIAKSDVRILIASTPNRPEGPAQKLQQEEPSLYHKTYLPYTVGLGTIYTKQQIQEQKKSPSFEQEYNLKFLGGIGNIFNQLDVDAAITKKYDISMKNAYGAIRIMGIDPAWGSSKFAVVITEWLDNTFRVLYADSWSRPLFNDMINEVITLAQQYDCCKILTDGANPSVVKTLKKYYGSGEFIPYEAIKDPQIVENWAYNQSCIENKVVPINFRLKHIELIQRAHRVLSKRAVLINPRFDKLITALRTATSRQSATGDTFDLDKNRTSESDILDSYMLSLMPVGRRFFKE
jgi:hypothetical protein